MRSGGRIILTLTSQRHKTPPSCLEDKAQSERILLIICSPLSSRFPASRLICVLIWGGFNEGKTSATFECHRRLLSHGCWQVRPELSRGRRSTSKGTLANRERRGILPHLGIWGWLDKFLKPGSGKDKGKHLFLEGGIKAVCWTSQVEKSDSTQPPGGANSVFAFP